MTLELTDAEREFLLDTLKDRLGTLRQQIHHSMTSTFTDQLKETEILMRGLIDKVEASTSE